MDRSFWLSRWNDNKIGFHRDEVNEHLVRWWPSLDAKKSSRVIVPLCGKTHDLVWLSEHYSTVGVELSPLAVEQFWSGANQTPERIIRGGHTWSTAGQLTTICGDFMTIDGADLVGFDHFYDRAALIALPPTLRTTYVSCLKRMLNKGASGLLITLDYDQTKIDGPPFSIGIDEVSRRFEPEFDIEILSSKVSEQAPESFKLQGVMTLTEHVLKISSRS